MSKKEENILKLLRTQGDMFITEIAKHLSISPTTASKYLGILEARGKVESRKMKPYIYWRIRQGE